MAIGNIQGVKIVLDGNKFLVKLALDGNCGDLTVKSFAREEEGPATDFANNLATAAETTFLGVE